MTATLDVLPGTRLIAVPRLTADQRAIRLARLADDVLEQPGRLPPSDVTVLLAAYASDSLHGDKLTRAWREYLSAVVLEEDTDAGIVTWQEIEPRLTCGDRAEVAREMTRANARDALHVLVNGEKELGEASLTATAEAPAVNGTPTTLPTDGRRTTALAVRSDPLPAKIEYAKALAESGLLPTAFRRNPGNVLFAIEYGDMLGLAPMAAITGIHVIEGKPSASAGLISALVRRAGHKLRVAGDARSATCQIVRCDDPEYTFGVTFTIEDAKTAGLTGKDVWKKYGASMLKARAITQCARDACEEALFGLHYTPEELGAEVDEDGRVVNAQFVDEAAAAQAATGNAVVEHLTATPADDPWYTPLPGGDLTGDDWVSYVVTQTRAEDFGADDGGRLWNQTIAKRDAGEITAEQSGIAKQTLAAAGEDLKTRASAAEAGVVDAEVVDGTVVPELDPADPWAAKAESVSDREDADAAIADVRKGMAAGRIAPVHGEDIIAVIEARVASLDGRAAA